MRHIMMAKEDYLTRKSENSWCEIGVPAVPAEGKILGGYIKNSWSFPAYPPYPPKDRKI